MINYKVDNEGIAVVEWDLPGKSQNVMNSASIAAWIEAMGRAMKDADVKGVLVCSAKKDFMAGGDLEQLQQMASAQDVFDMSMRLHTACRRFETSGKPIACALPGSALGGGLEVALVCHYRVAADQVKARFGLPEVTLGLLPGGGGTQRLPRLIGYAAAIPLMTEGKRIDVQQAKKIGLIDVIAPVGQERELARQWLLSEEAKEVKQPWDKKGFKVPGGSVTSEQASMFFMAANALTHSKTYGNYPAPRHILSCVYEGLSTDIDTGLKIEARYFAACVTSSEAKNMIRSLFFGIGDANKLLSRPQGIATKTYQRFGMLGAGMMGAGIAMAAAQKGIEVVLLDSSLEFAQKGKNYATAQWDKLVAKGRLTAEAAKAYADKIIPTDDYEQLKNCELVVEAVFESREIKAEVIRKAEAVMPSGAIFASNTSTLPITGLALTSTKPAHFIGLHFFSPAEKMPLVEIIMGEKTSDETLAHAMDFVRAIGKTPIVVNDSRGFYTSRVFGVYVNEGLAMLAEGISPALIDHAGLMSGMPVGPLALADEVSLELVLRVAEATKKDLGTDYIENDSHRVTEKMVRSCQRLGKKSKAGFYDYPDQGKKHIWPGLSEIYPQKPEDQQPHVDELIERLVMIQSVETLRCLEEKVLRNPIDADVGAILGWGYPAFRGGPLGWLKTLTLTRAQEVCERLQASYGARFAVPKILITLNKEGKELL